MLRTWNDTAVAAPAATFPGLFAAQVARAPDAPAIFYRDRILSYAEVDAQANRLAHHLRSLGAGPETVVASFVERSPEMVIGLVGILKAGAAYLPLDPDYPRERLAFMLEDANVQIVLTQSRLLERLPHTFAAELVVLEAEQSALEQRPSCSVGLFPDPNHPRT